MLKKLLLISVIILLGLTSYLFVVQFHDETSELFSTEVFKKNEKYDLKLYKDPTSNKKIYILTTKRPNFDLTFVRHEEGSVKKIKLGSNFILKGKYENPEIEITATYHNAKGQLHSQKIPAKMAADYDSRHKATVLFIFTKEMLPETYVALLHQKKLKVKLDSQLPLSYREVTFAPEEIETYTNFMTKKMPDIEDDNILNYDFTSKLTFFR